MSRIGIFNNNSHHAQAQREIEAGVRKHRRLFTAQWLEVLEVLQNLDPEWEQWYDARPEQTCGEMLPLMQERIKELDRAALLHKHIAWKII